MEKQRENEKGERKKEKIYAYKRSIKRKSEKENKKKEKGKNICI